MLDQLNVNERPVHEIPRAVNISSPSLKHHLNILRSAGLVRVRKVGRQRVYAFAMQPLRELVAWLSRDEDLWRPLTRQSRCAEL